MRPTHMAHQVPGFDAALLAQMMAHAGNLVIPGGDKDHVTLGGNVDHVCKRLAVGGIAGV